MKHDEMEAIGKKKWQVAVQLMKVEYYSVWAASAEEAGQLVTNGHFGAVLGSEGPAVVNVASKEVDPRQSDEDVAKGMEEAATETAKPKLIQVVKG